MPAEVLATVAPFLILPLLGFLSGPGLPLAAAGLAVGWGLVRLLRDRAISRVAVVSVVAPATFSVTCAAVYGIGGIVNALGQRPDSILSSVFMFGLMGAASGGVASCSVRWLARRSQADARFLLYLQALPMVAMLGALPMGGGWAEVLWPLLTAVGWALAVLRYLKGGPAAPERLGRRMRAWVSTGLVLFSIAALCGAMPVPAPTALAAVLALTAPFLWIDSRLDAGAAKCPGVTAGESVEQLE